MVKYMKDRGDDEGKAQKVALFRLARGGENARCKVKSE